jgi:signal transduction histidine kinase/putative methionine-R-sulfoxide reductase with GAF domain
MRLMTMVQSDASAGQTQIMEVLLAITRQIASPANLAEVLANSVAAIRANLGYEQVAVHLTRPDGDRLTLCAVAGPPLAAILPASYYLPCAGSSPGQAASSGQSFRVDDLASQPDIAPALGLPETVSELSVPILAGAEAMGALTVGATRPGCFSRADEALLILLAEQLAAVIRGADLYHHAAERQAQEALLARISHAINGSLDAEQMLAQAVAVIGNLLRVDRCDLGQVNLRAQSYLTEHEYVNPLLFERRSTKRPTPLMETLGEAVDRLRAGEVLISSGPEARPLPAGLWGQLANRYGVRSLVWVPIPSPGKESFYTLQLMQVTYARRWTADDVALLRRLVDQLAIALRNAELFNDTQRSAAAIKAKNVELETIVYTVSHDLQAAVASLGGFAALLQTRYKEQLDERGGMYVGRIAVNADYLDRMLRHLLELSRVGRVEEPDEIVPVGAVVEDVLNDLARLLAEGNVVLEAPSAWPLVTYSRIRLREVFSNLVSNAYKFLGPQPKPLIAIGWRRLLDEAVRVDRALSSAAAAGAPADAAPMPPGDHLIEFFVRDNGIGIDPRDQQRIFLPFQRVEKLKVEGTGVGLSIVKRIVEGRGGSIRVQSAPGQGTTFFFTVPAAADTDQLTPLGSETSFP